MNGLIIEQMMRRLQRLSLLLPVFCVIAGIILLFFHEQIIVHGFTALISIAIPVSGLFISVQDYGNNWYKYEKILPISDNKIVLSKLLCYLIDVALAFVLEAVFCGIAFFADSSLFDFGLLDVISLIIVLLSVVTLIGSFFYGGVYILGEEKSDIWLFTSIIIALVVTGVVVVSLNKSGIGKKLGLIILLCISFLALALSYFTASAYFRRGED